MGWRDTRSDIDEHILVQDTRHIADKHKMGGVKHLIKEPAEGKKYDDGKLRWDLLPMCIIEEVVEVLTLGAKKYGDSNWKQVENWEDRYYAAMMRHISKWRVGEKADDESGLRHLAHAICSAVFIMYLEDMGDK